MAVLILAWTQDPLWLASGSAKQLKQPWSQSSSGTTTPTIVSLMASSHFTEFQESKWLTGLFSDGNKVQMVRSKQGKQANVTTDKVPAARVDTDFNESSRPADSHLACKMVAKHDLHFPGTFPASELWIAHRAMSKRLSHNYYCTIDEVVHTLVDGATSASCDSFVFVVASSCNITAWGSQLFSCWYCPFLCTPMFCWICPSHTSFMQPMFVSTESALRFSRSAKS